MIHANRPQKKPDNLFIKDLKALNNKISISDEADQLFQTKISATFVKKINFADSNDPLAMQILPSKHELTNPDDFNTDPVGDTLAMKTPGLIHKYQSRVLFITTANCAIHCRYCFRRNFDYKNSVSKPSNLQKACQYLQNNPQINEVILSGGDPLTLNNQSLFTICDALLNITHIKTIRFHSRYPIVASERFNLEFTQYFSQYPLQKVFVSHVNHPNELNQQTHTDFNLLKQAGFTLLNQSVLLNNINDDKHSLIHLSYKLFEQGVLPYYLHLLDKVKGASHFLTNNQQNHKIIEQLHHALPGYLVPKVVREIAGKKSKTSFAKNSFSSE